MHHRHSPNKKLRSEGVPEEETNRFRAEGYSKSIFRTLQEVREPACSC